MTKETNRMKGESESLFIDEICQNTWKELYRFIYYKVQNREEAEDITQETYARAFSYLKRNDIKIVEYRGYLRSVAMNIIRDQWRLKKRKGQQLNIEDVNPESLSEDDFSSAATDRALIEEAMERLTEEQRMVIDLRILKGYSSADTARIMNKKEGTVRVIQYRAVKALTKLLNGLEKGRN